jgi:hypothetical protein
VTLAFQLFFALSFGFYMGLLAGEMSGSWLPWIAVCVLAAQIAAGAVWMWMRAGGKLG